MTLEEYFNGDELAASVWQGKYALEGEQTPDDMHKRMAKEFARIEKKYESIESNDNEDALSDYGLSRQFVEGSYEEKIYNLFKNFKYIVPQGSIMSMLGNKSAIGSLSNCFVVGQPEDSYGGIMYKDEQLVQLMKRRGGVGIDISTLRPNTVSVSNAAGTSTGAASFMERFSNTTREVAQAGRRGALMISIDVRHPDVFEFVNAKKDRTKVTGANISVMLRDDFMKALKDDGDYYLRFPCDSNVDWISYHEDFEYNELVEIHERNVARKSHDNVPDFVKRVKARELYDAIVENAWENAEPGQMFIDRHWDYSPDGVYPQYRGVTTNPCGEIFMQEYDACRLMALNLYSFVEKPFTKYAKINYKKLYEVAYEQQRLADNLVDLELEHIDRILAKIENDPENPVTKTREFELWRNIKTVAASGRRTGCGFTGLGDMLAACGTSYDSDDALLITNTVIKTKMKAELDCTIDLAIFRGTFEGWDWEKEFSITKGKNSFYQMLQENFPKQASRMNDYGRRNVSWSTVAPTGSVSILTQTTSGLEPMFQPYYMRRKKVNPSDEDVRVDFVDENGDSWTEFPVVHPKFEDWLLGHSVFEGIKETGIQNCSKEDLDEAFQASPWYKSTANDIDWIKRVELQQVIQKYTTHSISSTINLPEDVTQEEVAEIYMKSWEMGLKGVTVYRDGSRSGVLVNESQTKGFTSHDAPKRPETLDCDVFHVQAKGEKWTVVVGILEDRPYEVFASTEKFGKKNESGYLTKMGKGEYMLVQQKTTVENICIGMTEEEAALTRMISTALRHGAKIHFIVEQLNKADGDLQSFSKAVGRTLKKYIPDGEKGTSSCDNCGSDSVEYSEGCLTCKSCGNSKCG